MASKPLSPLAGLSKTSLMKALWAFALHALAVGWLRFQWGPGSRGGVLAWMDFPVSLAFAGLTPVETRALALLYLITNVLYSLLGGVVFLFAKRHSPRPAGT